jgi:general secretion pathway protein G
MNRAHSRSRSRGVTPVAAAVAVLVVGAGASCMWWVGSLGTARDDKTSSQADAAQIQTAAKAFRAQHADGCPTFSSLQHEEFLSRNARSDDAWGNRFRISCEGGEISVSSAGPDHKPHSADDVSASR